MAGFIALQMSIMWGMFEGEERTLNAGLEGKPGCPYHNDFKRFPRRISLCVHVVIFRNFLRLVIILLCCRIMVGFLLRAPGITRDIRLLVVLIVVGVDVDVEPPGGDQLRFTFQA